MTQIVEPQNVNEWCAALRTALHSRSGKRWSVRHPAGTARGWITILANAARCLTPAEAAELAALLGLAEPVHFQGYEISPSLTHRRECLARARGATPMFGRKAPGGEGDPR